MEDSVWSGTLQAIDTSLPQTDQWVVTPSPKGDALSLLAKDQMGATIQPGSAPQTKPFLFACQLGLSPSPQAGKATADLRFNVTWSTNGRVVAVFTFGTASKIRQWSSQRKKSGDILSSKTITLRLKAPIPAEATTIPFTMYALVETKSVDGMAMFQVDSVDFGGGVGE